MQVLVLKLIPENINTIFQTILGISSLSSPNRIKTDAEVETGGADLREQGWVLGPSLHLNLHPCFFSGWIFILIPQALSVAQSLLRVRQSVGVARGVSSQIRSDHSRQEEELGFSAHGVSTRLPQPRVCLSSFPSLQRPPALQSSIS